MPRQAAKILKFSPKRVKNSHLNSNVLPKYCQQRPDGLYCRRYFPANERDEKGRVKYIQVTRKVDPPTEERAKEVSDAIEAAYLKAITPRAHGTTVHDLASDFADAKKNAVEPRTYSYYKWMLRYFKGAFGQKEAIDVTPRDVQSFYALLEQQGSKPGMIRKIHIHLSMVFKQAIRWKVLTDNPCDGVVRPRAVRSDIEIMTEKEARAFRKIAMVEAPILAFALDSWMRPNEYVALSRHSVKLDKGLVTVERTVEFLEGGGFTFKNKTKTDAGRRTILVSEPIREMLAALPESELMFPSRDGTPIRPGNLGRRTMKAICKKAKIKPKTLYSLRHTGISIAIANGADIKSVSERAGHKSVQITLDTYGHLMPKGLHRTVEIFSEALYG